VSRSPQLGKYQAERNKGPYLDRIATYLAAEAIAGTLSIPDVRRAAHQFMGLITAEVLNPGLLLVDFAVTDAEAEAAVDEAVKMIVARYARPTPRG
jgi:TetR/AcrR family transcriptional regulator of autoinduction and epiphytic fitness